MKDGFGDYMLNIGTLAQEEPGSAQGTSWGDGGITSWLERSQSVVWREIQPNTFAVAGPNFDVGKQARNGLLPVGPNADKVRLLPGNN